MIAIMVGAVTILIDGLSAERADSTPLPVAALNEGELDRVMQSWHPHR